MTPAPDPALPFLNREISWLGFNHRVLEEAEDRKNPLLERLRFFCIFHSNLDEFFMVRVGALVRRLHEGDATPDPAGLSPFRERELITARVRELEDASYRLYNDELLPALAERRIRILAEAELEPAQRRYLDDYFVREIYPVLTPLAVESSKPFPHLSNLSLNLAVLLAPAGGGSGEEAAPESRLAVVQVPGRLAGLCRLPDAADLTVCWLVDVVRARLDCLFSGNTLEEVAAFRLTRDAELELDDEGGEDYVLRLQSELRKRRAGRPLRLEIEAGASAKLVDLLALRLGVEPPAVIPVRGPLDTRPLEVLVEMPGYDALRDRPQPPLLPLALRHERSIFEIVREQDILLHHPYDSFDPVLELIEAAAADPGVLAIKQTLYRTGGGGSRVPGALIRAAEHGKQVTALIELTARFDEERNISWARHLEEAGAHVLYGLVGLKAHAKVALVVRREPDGIRRYVHLGTGNYNERTARAYSDFGLLTAVPEFGSDISGFFNAVTGYSEPPEFARVVMAPFGLRQRLVSLIRREADRARAGQPGRILAKLNSLVDPQIILELCAAGTAGVAVDLIVRGICCLRPGVPGVSDNVRVVSILDRYLEHGRAHVFRNGGDPEVYLSSADWMPRNLDRRVELMFPVLDPAARDRVVDALETQLADNQKARVLRSDGRYRRVSAARVEPVRAQQVLYRRLLDLEERAGGAADSRITPLEGSKPHP